MKELKALEILESLQYAIFEANVKNKCVRFTNQHILDIDKAIAELEALQAPKTCDGCIHDRKEPIGEYNFCDCCSRANRDKYEPKDSQ